MQENFTVRKEEEVSTFGLLFLLSQPEFVYDQFHDLQQESISPNHLWKAIIHRWNEFWAISFTNKTVTNFTCKHNLKLGSFVTPYALCQAWATSDPRATYGPPSTLMWPASYIWSFLNTYIDYEVIEYQEITCFITKTTLKQVLARGYQTCL
jgi:hypothetical protein